MPAVGTGATAWKATGWKGERLNAIVLIWSPDALQQVRLEPTDLTDAKGRVLSRNNIRLQAVRYVLSNYPARATNATCDAASSSQAWLLPDRLEPLDRFDTAARTVRPVWLPWTSRGPLRPEHTGICSRAWQDRHGDAPDERHRPDTSPSTALRVEIQARPVAEPVGDRLVLQPAAVVR